MDSDTDDDGDRSDECDRNVDDVADTLIADQVVAHQRNGAADEVADPDPPGPTLGIDRFRRTHHDSSQSGVITLACIFAE
jgi:hypothetical protein